MIRNECKGKLFYIWRRKLSYRRPGVQHCASHNRIVEPYECVCVDCRSIGRLGPEGNAIWISAERGDVVLDSLYHCAMIEHQDVALFMSRGIGKPKMFKR
jgi:hypothetical protein